MSSCALTCDVDVQSRMISLALVIVAVYNAYVLFSKRRTYWLWYRDEHVREDHFLWLTRDRMYFEIRMQH